MKSTFNNMPKISILCSAYNSEKYFSECIESVLRQTFIDFEFVICDDGSTDDTLKIAQSFDDKRITLIGDGKNRGQNTRLAQMMKMARGDYVGWIDADDMFDPQTLELTSFILDHYPDYGVVYTDHYEMDKSGKVLSVGMRSKMPFSKDLLLRDFMTFHFRLFRQDLYGKIEPLCTEPHGAADYELSIKFSEITNFMHLPQPLYYYRIHPDSLSKQQGLALDETVLQLYREAIKRRKLPVTVKLYYENGKARYKYAATEEFKEMVARKTTGSSK